MDGIAEVRGGVFCGRVEAGLHALPFFGGWALAKAVLISSPMVSMLVHGFCQMLMSSALERCLFLRDLVLRLWEAASSRRPVPWSAARALGALAARLAVVRNFSKDSSSLSFLRA